MDELKEYILEMLEELHLKIYFKQRYLNTKEGAMERFQDVIKYEQLKEVVRMNPDWDNEEFAKELSKRVQKQTTL